MKPIYSLALIFASLFLSSQADAHFVWAMVGPGGKNLRMEIAESPGESVVPMLGKLIPSIKKYGVEAFSEEPDHMHVGAPLSRGNAVGGIDLLYGVHGVDLIHWSAKGAVSIEAAGKTLGLPAEVLIRHSKSGLVAVVLKNGKPAPGAEVEFYAPGAKEAVTLKTGANGTVALPDVKRGMIAVGAIVKEAGTGDYKGLHYNDKIDMSSLTVQVG